MKQKLEQELAMTSEQYSQMVREIWSYHRFGGLSSVCWDDEIRQSRCKHIKYVRPNWDLRDGLCFSIRFDGMGCGKDGTQFNSGYGQTVPLFDQIMTWLNTPREEKTDVPTSDRQTSSSGSDDTAKQVQE